ncbi:GGDEF domain-containing protein [Vibrio sp. RE86]|uniref:tetratricopeptide repeat-containing diguanylate cyclase n=1 Tax=Vibrio sp. RE86 TaxID=2607605 RepID=UPI001493C23C|nr:tetratricopeptide repeat-containing diguanylate cyclase [Vibrio sp. RE86]NOH78408.1 GGDEF domain-containing protein [Vibrio sp. RE86]
MKRLIACLIPILILCVSPQALSACDVGTHNDYLDSQIKVDDRALLEFYYASLCRPGTIQIDQIEERNSDSAQALALYYFGRLNLQKYQGIQIDNPPDLVKLGQSNNIDWIVAEAKLLKAIKLIDNDQLLEGELLMHEVIPLARGIGYQRLLARTYRWLGNVAIQRSDLKASLNYYKTAFEIVTEIDDQFQATMTLNNIGTVYMESEEWQRAQDYVDKAIKLYQSNHFDNSLFEAILYANSSAISFATNHHAQAKQYMYQALEEAEKTGSTRIKTATLSNISQLYSTVGRPVEALAMANKCLNQLQDEPKSSLLHAICYEGLASAYLVQEDYGKAIVYAQKILNALSRSESKETGWELDVLTTLIEAYEAQQDYQLALSYMKQRTLLKENFYRQTISEEIVNEKSTLERKLYKREVELLAAQNDLQSLAIKEQRSKEILFIVLLAVVGYFVTRGILRLRRTNQELESQNTTDTLTGAFNRRYLDNWLAHPRRVKEHPNYLLAVVDIDHFKSFNDLHGHEVGDKVLIETVHTLQRHLRSQDLLVRWGGEEFVLLIPNEHLSNASNTLERLRSSIEAHTVQFNDQEFKVTISVGAIQCSASDLMNSWEHQFNQADAGLYRAKRSGRNGFFIAS